MWDVIFCNGRFYIIEGSEFANYTDAIIYCSKLNGLLSVNSKLIYADIHASSIKQITINQNQ